jgi:hypothetical protein
MQEELTRSETDKTWGVGYRSDILEGGEGFARPEPKKP